MAVRMMRLDKYLADMGEGTRQEVKKYIRKGLVTVDGVAVCSPEYKVEAGMEILLDGAPVAYAAQEYYMLHKPAGVVSATEDGRGKTVLDLMPEELRRRTLFPVGRLDKDTEGLLLLTDDGALARMAENDRQQRRYSGLRWRLKKGADA